MSELFTIIGLAIKLAVLIIEKTSKTDAEKRRESLAQLDDAITKAKESKDLTELSKWMGKLL